MYLKYFRNRDYLTFLSGLRRDVLAVHDNSPFAIATVAEKGFAARGRQGMLEDLVQVQEKQDLVPPNEVAWPSALLGKQIEALRYLNTAYEEWDGAPLFVEVYPEFDSLRA